MAPTIGITFTYRPNSETNNDYIQVIKRYGGTPNPLYPNDPIGGIDGLLLTGGPDIHPSRFGEEEHPALESVNKERDKWELALYEEAIKENIPVFGICRGIQIMNVAMDGSLYQDIPSQFTTHLTHKILENKDDSWHYIKIQPGSLLNQITGDTIAAVNSRHHQTVKCLGDGFVTTAQSKDGVIEALEDPSKQFVLGVQYHPERMLQIAEFQGHAAKLFTAFIKTCS